MLHAPGEFTDWVNGVAVAVRPFVKIMVTHSPAAARRIAGSETMLGIDTGFAGVSCVIE